MGPGRVSEDPFITEAPRVVGRGLLQRTRLWGASPLDDGVEFPEAKGRREGSPPQGDSNLAACVALGRDFLRSFRDNQVTKVDPPRATPMDSLRQARTNRSMSCQRARMLSGWMIAFAVRQLKPERNRPVQRIHKDGAPSSGARVTNLVKEA